MNVTKVYKVWMGCLNHECDFGIVFAKSLKEAKQKATQALGTNNFHIELLELDQYNYAYICG